MERHQEGRTMSPRADSATLNVQPRQRRDVYESLAKQPEGRSVKELLSESDIPEAELRETLRKLDQAGLVKRTRRTWSAIPLEPPDGEPPTGAVA
jgi:DNA-binding transcriptional ArsR family regulator